MGINKTKNQIQMAAYGGFQAAIRSMTKDQQDQYSPMGTPERDRYEARVEAAVERRQLRKKLLKEWVKENKKEYTFHNVQMSEEQLAKLIQLEKDYGRRLNAFKAQLDKDYPAIVA